MIDNLLAQVPLAPQGGYKGPGPLGLNALTPADAPGVFNKLISSIIGILTIIAIIWFTFIIITGAISVMTAGGDKGALEGAKKKITNGIVGIAITLSAIFIIDIVGYFLGIPNILGIVEWINKLAP